MAEAEDVITDVARHATVFVQQLWRRHHPPADSTAVTLDDIAARLELLLVAVFRRSFTLRTAQPPPRPTLLGRLFGHHRAPWVEDALPANDGVTIWLPATAAVADVAEGRERYRVAALQQAMRAERGSAAGLAALGTPVEVALHLLLEAQACDAALLERVPGLTPALRDVRWAALAERPPLAAFPAVRQPLERLVRRVLEDDCAAPGVLPVTPDPATSAGLARRLAAELFANRETLRRAGPEPMWRDWWIGDLRPSPALGEEGRADGESAGGGPEPSSTAPRSARLSRRPQVREAKPDEDAEQEPGPWMVQADQPHQHAEDPLGLQRPLDRDEEIAAEQFGDLVSELPEARLVSTPGRPPEILLSDDPPAPVTRGAVSVSATQEEVFRYPEWDYRSRSYARRATVIQLAAVAGLQAWVDATLAEHRSLLDTIRRRFEMLKAERMCLRRQLDGDEIDLEAYTESFADVRAGQPQSDRIYQTTRPARRSIAVSLLVDISGSTDGWVAANRRVIDVEREALLLVCLALQALGEPFAVTAFSGSGPHAVTLHPVKRFDELYGNDVALRIAALEPQYFTRTGAAIRHAAAALMQQPAAHRLLLLLSDGKPNDIDDYEGRYGIEDVRQAVIEARLQQVHPFCLTIDRQGAGYLPHMFGVHRYALLTAPQALPRVLLEWVRQLLAH